MDVDTHRYKVVGNAVNNAALPALPVNQACELAIRIVERVGANKQRHADGIRSKITLIEQMSSDDSEDTREQSHARRLQFNLCEKLRETKSDWPGNIRTEDSFHSP